VSLSLCWLDRERDAELYRGERRLRFEILRRPLGMPEGSEENAAEARCSHCVAVLDGEVVGCVLWLPDADDASGQPGSAGPSGVGRAGKLLQMAVAETLQGQGVGARLVRELEAMARAQGFERVRMHARASAVGFYAKLGYAVTGEPFSEVGIPHRLMERVLQISDGARATPDTPR